MHQSSQMLEVPLWYFTNKILYGTLWACLAGLFVTKLSIPKQAAVITIVTVTLLQIRYLLYGYPVLFHLIVFPEHLFFLYVATYYMLKISK
ncbi:hypothetical protein HZC31_00645 [Candidatus Woesearchaeota archaeon]|nr:hypothetical protein [Candidatus Woesearchaeota archaeon]